METLNPGLYYVTPGSKTGEREEPPHLCLSLAEPASTTSASTSGATAREPALSGTDCSPPHKNLMEPRAGRSDGQRQGVVLSSLPSRKLSSETCFSFLETDPLSKPLAFLGLGSSSVEMIESFKSVQDEQGPEEERKVLRVTQQRGQAFMESHCMQGPISGLGIKSL